MCIGSVAKLRGIAEDKGCGDVGYATCVFTSEAMVATRCNKVRDNLRGNIYIMLSTLLLKCGGI